MNDSREPIPFYAVSYEQVLLALVAIVLAAGLSILNRSRLERQFLWGAIRSFLQLWMVGYVLVFLFDSHNMPLLILTRWSFKS
jgi:putative ABC transport system permease protein